MRSLNLFKQWISHDLVYGMEIFDKLPIGRREEYWDWIEELYLQRYRKCFRLEMEWGSTGIWHIPLPGSL